LDSDNRIGKFIFFATGIIQNSGLLKRGILSLVKNEQLKDAGQRKMSAVLWDTFTGSAPYKSILIRFTNPRLLGNFVWHSVKALYKK
jgi:hypothetical protein